MGGGGKKSTSPFRNNQQIESINFLVRKTRVFSNFGSEKSLKGFESVKPQC